jgi:hypothetical protein
MLLKNILMSHMVFLDVAKDLIFEESFECCMQHDMLVAIGIFILKSYGRSYYLYMIFLRCKW